MAHSYCPNLLRSNTPILGTSATVVDFWRWAYSDFRSNTTRPLLAEYLVGSALGAIDRPREEWASVDLTYRGTQIEVKSSGWVQSWRSGPAHARNIRFDIAPKKEWDPVTNTYSDEATRSAQIYVFCLHIEKNPDRYNALDVAQWEFYILSTSTISVQLGNQKSIAISRLRNMVNPLKLGELKEEVDRHLDRRVPDRAGQKSS